MKIIKRFYSALALIAAGGALIAIAGCIGGRSTSTLVPPMDETNAMVELIDMEIGLDDNQRNSVHELVAQSAQVKQKIYDQYRGRPTELRDAESTRLKKFDRQMRALLSPPQQHKWPALFRDIYAHELDPVEKGRLPEESRNDMHQPGGGGF